PRGDGALGVKRVREAAGLTIAQLSRDVTDAMPRAAVETGMVDFVLPVEDIGPKLVSLARVAIPPDEPRQPDVEHALRDILTLLRVRTGHDFAAYKYSTLL